VIFPHQDHTKAIRRLRLFRFSTGQPHLKSSVILLYSSKYGTVLEWLKLTLVIDYVGRNPRSLLYSSTLLSVTELVSFPENIGSILFIAMQGVEPSLFVTPNKA